MRRAGLQSPRHRDQGDDPMTQDAQPTLTAREFLDECAAFKGAHAPKSKFLFGLVKGKLTDAHVRRWAADFYYYVEPAIPTIAAWLSSVPTVPDRSIYRLLARNLAGEMGYIKEAEHYELYLQFLAGLGLSRDEVEKSLPLPST